MRLSRSPLLRALIAGLWAGMLFLPFGGAAAAALLCAAVTVGLAAVFSAPRLEIAARLSRRGDAVLSIPRLKRLLPVLAVAVVLVLPFGVKDYYLDVLVIAGIYVLLALGLNVIVGYTGLLNLGFAAFYAIGAYAYALLNTKLGLGFWATLPLSAAAASLAGSFLAVPALRLRGDYLAIVTLGFGEILRLVLNNWDSLTNGPNGISGIEPPSVAGFSLDTLGTYYYLVLGLAALGFFVIRRVEGSRIGRAWIAIREDEIAAAAMGIDTTRYKLYAFAFGAFWAGIAGILFAAKMRFVSPESFTFMESVMVLSMIILGGLGALSGAVLGAVLLVVLPEVLREVQLYRMLLLGAGLVLLMIFRPQGLIGKTGVTR